MLRSLAERLSRGVVLKRKLPTEFGGAALYVTPDASLKYWRRDLSKTDPFLLRMAKELAHPGEVVWDIGANVGLFAFACAGLGAQVIAIEPDATLSDLLCRSQAVNQSSVTVRTVAISDRVEKAPFHIAKRGRATNHLGESVSTQTGGIREIHIVEVVTLDSLLDSFPAPDVLKIDVEGAEANALRGASEVLKAHPRILIEVAGCHSDEVTRILKEHDYKLFNAETKERVERATWNTLAFYLATQAAASHT